MNEDVVPKWNGRAKVLPDNDPPVVAAEGQKDRFKNDMFGEKIICPKCKSRHYKHIWCPSCGVYFCEDCGHILEKGAMDFDEYQKRCRETDLFPPKKEESVNLLEYRTLCINGEVGELSEKILDMALAELALESKAGKLANKVKKIRRDGLSKKLKDGITHELGDIMWYLSILCDLNGVTMKEVAERNITMLADRKKRDVIKGSGDDR